MSIKRIVKMQNGSNNEIWDPEKKFLYNGRTQEEPQPIQEDIPYEPTLEDLIDFTTGFEVFRPNVYQLETSDKTRIQDLAGYGSTNPKILALARQGKLTEDIARQEVRDSMNGIWNNWKQEISGFDQLPIGVQFALIDTAYNGKGVKGTIKNSPNLTRALKNGITDAETLVKYLTHSKTAGGWLGVRSSARRAMALGKYNWQSTDKDKYGRQIDSTKPATPKDWTRSPYYNMFYKGGILKRIK